MSLAWSFPSPCFGLLCLHAAVALAWLLQYIIFLPQSLWIGHSLLFELSCKLTWRLHQPGPMTCVPCLIWLRYVEPWLRCIEPLSSFSLFFLLLFHATHVIHPSSSRFNPPGWGFWAPLGLLEVSVIGRHWSGTSRFSLSNRLRGEVNFGLIDGGSHWWRQSGSTLGVSAKENSYFHMHGRHFYVSLAWSFPSPCFGRLCLHVVVALAWLLQSHGGKLSRKRPTGHFRGPLINIERKTREMMLNTVVVGYT